MCGGWGGVRERTFDFVFEGNIHNYDCKVHSDVCIQSLPHRPRDIRSNMQSPSFMFSELAHVLVFLSGTEGIALPRSCSEQNVEYRDSDQKLIPSADLTMLQGQSCLRY